MEQGVHEFEYLPLALNEIRLLSIDSEADSAQITCTLQHYPLEEGLDYLALSYTWGNEPADHSITINGKPFRLRPNLHAALYEFQRESIQFEGQDHIDIKATASNSQPQLIWIDAICINQNDVQERNLQVQRMRNIYKTAKGLVVWLGPAKYYTHHAFTVLKEYIAEGDEVRAEVQHDPFEQWLQYTKHARSLEEFVYTCQAVASMLWMPWFRRAWIIQEFALARPRTEIEGQILICCGEERITRLMDIDIMAGFIHRFDIRTGFRPSFLEKFCSQDVEPFAGKYFEVLANLVLSRLTYTCPEEKPNAQPEDSLERYQLLPNVITARNSIATDPRDKIYAVIGLTEEICGAVPLDLDIDTLIVDYDASVEAVYSSFVQSVVKATDRLDILGCCLPHNDSKIRASWVPDWTIPYLRHGFINNDLGLNKGSSKSFAYNCTPGTRCVAKFSEDGSTLTVKGVEWAKIHLIGEIPPRFDEENEDETNGFKKLCTMWCELINRVDQDADALSILLKVLLINGSQQNVEHGLSKAWKEIFREWLESDYLMPPLDRTQETAEDSLPQFPADTTDPDPNRPPPFPSLPRLIYDLEKAQMLAASGDAQDINESEKLVTETSRQVQHFPGGLPEMLSALLASRDVLPYLIFTDEFTAGRSSHAPEQGDLVCVIFGCAMPLVLRPVDGKYKVIGEIYLHGIMEGEVSEALSNFQLVSKEFVLQ